LVIKTLGPELDPDPDLDWKLDMDQEPDLDQQLEKKCWIRIRIK
jgi:hypothetical protein